MSCSDDKPDGPQRFVLHVPRVTEVQCEHFWQWLEAGWDWLFGSTQPLEVQLVKSEPASETKLEEGALERALRKSQKARDLASQLAEEVGRINSEHLEAGKEAEKLSRKRRKQRS